MKQSSKSKNAKSKIGTSSFHWFGRGLIGGVLLVAAANAASYFFRTPGIADLLGPDQNLVEALGFPFEIWQEDKIYFGRMFIDYSMVAFNLLVGLALGAVFGVVALSLKPLFNNWVAEFETDQPAKRGIQYKFSIKSMMIMTSVVAMLVAALTTWNGTKQVLIAIYFLGPLGLILIAMSPSKLHWHHRIVMLVILAAVMIGVAVTTGIQLKVPLDRVMLGIFVSWTPQSAFAAFLIVAGLIARSLWLEPKVNPSGS